MIWTYSWLTSHGREVFTFKEIVEIEQSLIESKQALLLDLKDVVVNGKGKLDPEKRLLSLSLQIEGMMIVPCALTLEETLYPFKIETDEVVSFNKMEENEEYFVVGNEVLDLNDLIWQLISFEIPLKVIKEGASIKTGGDGWVFISADQQDDKEEDIDPRLAKLKDYFKK